MDEEAVTPRTMEARVATLEADARNAGRTIWMLLILVVLLVGVVGHREYRFYLAREKLEEAGQRFRDLQFNLEGR